jgi:hypothetical protein
LTAVRISRFCRLLVGEREEERRVKEKGGGVEKWVSESEAKIVLNSVFS